MEAFLKHCFHDQKTEFFFKKLRRSSVIIHTIQLSLKYAMTSHKAFLLDPGGKFHPVTVPFPWRRVSHLLSITRRPKSPPICQKGLGKRYVRATSPSQLLCCEASARQQSDFQKYYSSRDFRIISLDLSLYERSLPRLSTVVPGKKEHPLAARLLAGTLEK